jgi:predicted SpoU family rRNA methylase
MKFTLPWLKEHLETDASLSEIVDKLTMIGLEVENVEDRASLLKPFVIASVISAEKHPNAGYACAWSTSATANPFKSSAARPMRAPA